MSSIGFNTGLKALLASQAALNTVGHNIANVGIPGYSQQSVMFDTSSPLSVRGLLIGSGVNASSVQRNFDSVLQSRIYSRQGIGSSFLARANSFGQIEEMFAEPNGYSLGKSIDSFFASASSLSVDPGDGVLRTGMTQAAMDLTTVFNELSSTMTSFEEDNTMQIKAEVNVVNDYAAQIAVLNMQIAETEATGITANDLRDQRGLTIEKLSQVVGVKVIESPTGAITVTVGGATLVGSKGAYKMSTKPGNSEKPEIMLAGVVGSIDVKNGTLGAHLDVSNSSLPKIGDDLDQLAKELIYQINKVHSTGVPGSGPYTSLVGDNAIGDLDKDGKFTDELLNNGSLPFEVKSGDLYVTVTEADTGEITKHKLSINGKKTTMGELTAALDAIPHINAEIGSLGNLRIVSDAGYGYDFSPKLDTNPDNAGSFGSGKASLGTQGVEPFVLADGQSLNFSVDLAGVPTPVSVGFALGDFKDITEATAAEIAAVINADPGAQAAGLEASEVGGHLVVQTSGSGANEAFSLTAAGGGAALAALGWTGFVGSPITGSDNAATPVISGAFTGDGNGKYTFQPTGDGIVGTTPGLGVEVFDEKGNLVVTLDVGEGYVPGTEISVANGVMISFGLGDLSATNGDVFELDVVSDPDTTDVLVALGIGGLFTGSGAVDISLRDDIEMDPELLAAAFSDAESDGGALLELFAMKDESFSSLGGGTFDEYYGQLVGNVGFEASTAMTALNANNALLGSLQQQREQVSGVNLDEEMTNMLRFEQSYQAAAQYISVVNQLTETILSLI